MPSFGFPELLVISFATLIYAIPIAAGVWIILTLRRVHSGVMIIKGELEEIKRLLPEKKS